MSIAFIYLELICNTFATNNFIAQIIAKKIQLFSYLLRLKKWELKNLIGMFY
jgi:hypothetical protein